MRDLGGICLLVVLLAGCCPEDRCAQEINFNVRDSLTGGPVQELAVEISSGEVDCTAREKQTHCGGHAGGAPNWPAGPADNVEMTLSAPGYLSLPARAVRNTDEGFCPGCPKYDVYVGDGTVPVHDISLQPVG